MARDLSSLTRVELFALNLSPPMQRLMPHVRKHRFLYWGLCVLVFLVLYAATYFIWPFGSSRGNIDGSIVLILAVTSPFWGRVFSGNE